MLNDAIHYQPDGALYCDGVALSEIAAQCGTPTYVYSLPRALANLQRIQSAFAALKPHIHYSAKANGNLAILRTLIEAGAGIDAVSSGEIHRALTAGANPEDIVFAGVGKTPDELRYAVEQGVGWFNVENQAELEYINAFVSELGRAPARIALRLNPEVTANTHPYIATGHGGAKFGLTAETIREILNHQTNYPHLNFAGIHIHIGSQLHDTVATHQAIQTALDLIAPYPQIRTVNIGGGLPVAYKPGEELPSSEAFAAELTPLLKDYELLLEPGRAIIADAGLLLVKVLYVKRQAGQTMVIVDGSMAELIRPALYQAHHEIVPVQQSELNSQKVHVVGPVCETADVLGREVMLPEVQAGDLLAVLTAGAYGMVMASNYNARLRPAEVVIEPGGESWHVARQRETWDDLLRLEK
ncbi:MAG TPA: diaminopimelate decarboxylase [Phototrophicaceae bacterium]|jgi:diaminopimelate decarboxylase|nr:diaminopimelate decarboxylase [Phototrophicaceae bacterium]